MYSSSASRLSTAVGKAVAAALWQLKEWAVPSPDLELQVMAGAHSGRGVSICTQQASPLAGTLITQCGCWRSSALFSQSGPVNRDVLLAATEERGSGRQYRRGCRPLADWPRLLKVSLCDTLCFARRRNYFGTNPAWVRLRSVVVEIQKAETDD